MLKKIATFILQILTLTVIMISLVLLSILPTMGEIIMEERGGVLYASNVCQVSTRSANVGAD